LHFLCWFGIFCIGLVSSVLDWYFVCSIGIFCVGLLFSVLNWYLLCRIGIFCVGLVFSVLFVVCSVLFYSSTSWYNFLYYCILLFYCTVHSYLFFCVLLLVMYVSLTVYIYCTLTLPPGVNPVAVNKYLCLSACLYIYLPTYLNPLTYGISNQTHN
jgi:hypothetical protein